MFLRGGEVPDIQVLFSFFETVSTLNLITELQSVSEGGNVPDIQVPRVLAPPPVPTYSSPLVICGSEGGSENSSFRLYIYLNLHFWPLMPADAASSS